MKAWARLKGFLAGPLHSQAIVHYCPAGCHKSKEEALDQLVDDIAALFFDHPPPVPAWNKWSKLVPPLLWFATFAGLHGILPAVLTSLTECLDVESLQFDEDDLVGLDSQRAFLQQQTARLRKTTRFMAAEPTVDKLMASTLVLSLVERNIMAKCFKASRRFENGPGALLLVHRSCSPVTAVLRALCSRLQSEGAECWSPFIGDRAWSEPLYISASTPVWEMIGQLFLAL
jgi:hypothetical protein